MVEHLFDVQVIRICYILFELCLMKKRKNKKEEEQNHYFLVRFS